MPQPSFFIFSASAVVCRRHFHLLTFRGPSTKTLLIHSQEYKTSFVRLKSSTARPRSAPLFSNNKGPCQDPDKYGLIPISQELPLADDRHHWNSPWHSMCQHAFVWFWKRVIENQTQNAVTHTTLYASNSINSYSSVMQRCCRFLR